MHGAIMEYTPVLHHTLSLPEQKISKFGFLPGSKFLSIHTQTDLSQMSMLPTKIWSRLHPQSAEDPPRQGSGVAGVAICTHYREAHGLFQSGNTEKEALTWKSKLKFWWFQVN